MGKDYYFLCINSERKQGGPACKNKKVFYAEHADLKLCPMVYFVATVVEKP
jgi:hypothetical protein